MAKKIQTGHYSSDKSKENKEPIFREKIFDFIHFYQDIPQGPAASLEPQPGGTVFGT